MNEYAGQFRSVLGGFHRQDVLDYIQTLTQESQDQINALTKQLEVAQTDRDSMLEALKNLRSSTAQTETKCKALESDLAHNKAKVESLSSALAEREAQVNTLQRRVAELEPEAASWQNIKSTAGDIEVTAHERAQIIIQEAQTKAAEIRAEGIRWVMDIQDRCDKLQKDLGISIRLAETELDAARRAFARTELDMEGFQASLSALVSALDAEEETAHSGAEC